MGFMDKLKGVSQVAAGVVGDVLVSVGNSLEKVSEPNASQEQASTKTENDFLQNLTYVGSIEGDGLPVFDMYTNRACVLGVFNREHRELDPQKTRMVVYTEPTSGVPGDLEFVTEFSSSNIVSVKVDGYSEIEETSNSFTQSKENHYFYIYTIKFSSGAIFKLTQLIRDCENDAELFNAQVFEKSCLGALEWILRVCVYVDDDYSKEVINKFFKLWGGGDFLPFQEVSASEENETIVYGDLDIDKIVDGYIKCLEYLADYCAQKYSRFM